MFRPEHQYTFRAQRKFTDRNESRSLFINAVDDPQPHEVNNQGSSPNRVLMFYGVGGQGKSALYKNLDEWLTRQTGIRRQEGWQRLAHVTLDLEEGREGRFLNPLEVLLRLRLVLKARGGFPCPHFDVAFARYFALSRPGVNIREAHPELFRSQNELVSDAVDMAEDAFGKLPDDLLSKITEMVSDGVSEIPGWGFLVKYADRLRIRGQEWWEQRGLELLDTLDDKNQAELLQDLPLYLGADLTRAQEANPKLRLVVLIDTFEYLWRDTSARGHSYLIDDWLQRLIINAPGVLFTIFGRDKVRWGETDAAWNSVLEQHRLGGLSDEDSDTFLRQAGLEEVEIRQVIVASSKGGAPGETPACLPYYLDLQLQQYEKDRNGGRTPQVESYGGSHTEITERFLKTPYTDRTALQTLLVVTCARTLTRELYDALTQTFLAQQALSYTELATYSFVTEQDGQLALHALMREYLQTKYLTEDQSRFNAVHAWLFTRYDAQARPETVPEITPQHEGALREAAFHKEQTDKVGFAAWCLRRCGIYLRAARYELTSELYRQAWTISEAANGQGHPDTLVSIGNLAVNLDAQGQHAEAQQLHEQVLEIRTRIWPPEHRDTLVCMNNLALNLTSQSKYPEAQRFHERVLEIRLRNLGQEHPDTLATMNNLALNLSFQGLHPEAQKINEKVVEGSKRTPGLEHPDALTSMSNLASNLSAQGQYPKAQKLIEQVLEIRTRILGSEHPKTLESMSELAKVTRDSGNAKRALPMFEDVARQSVRTFGETDLRTLQYWNDFVVTLLKAGDPRRARQVLAGLYPKVCDVLGSEHLWALDIKKFLDAK